jgi:hypothetical protein
MDESDVKGVASNCFLHCVDKFTTAHFSAAEELCLHHCIEKYDVAFTAFTGEVNAASREFIQLRQATGKKPSLEQVKKNLEAKEAETLKKYG